MMVEAVLIMGLCTLFLGFIMWIKLRFIERRG